MVLPSCKSQRLACPKKRGQRVYEVSEGVQFVLENPGAYIRPIPESIRGIEPVGDATVDAALWLEAYDRLRESAAVGQHGYSQEGLMLAKTFSNNPE